MTKPLKLMLLAANISIRPSLFLSIQFIFLLIASVIATISAHDSTRFVNGIVGIGMLSTYFGSFTTGISCICTALSAESLRLPFANASMMLRAVFITLGFSLAPYVLLLVITHHQPYWFISILLLLHSITLLILMAPAAISAPIYFVALSQITRIGEIVQLREQDSHSVPISLVLSATLYFLAWKRFEQISQRPASTIKKMSFVEIRNYGKTDPALTGNNIYSAFFASDDSKTIVRLPKGNPVEAMRMIMLPKSSINFWSASAMVLLFACIFAVKMFTHSIDSKPLIPIFVAMFAVLLIPALPMVALTTFFGKGHDDLNELALLPGLATQSSLLHTLRLTVLRPVVLASVLVFVLTFAALFFTSLSITSILVVTILTTISVMGLQALQYLFVFRFGTMTKISVDKVNSLTALMFCAQLALGVSALVVINRAADFTVTETSVSAPVSIFAFIASVLAILGVHWYRQLKALPHPFVTFL